MNLDIILQILDLSEAAHWPQICLFNTDVWYGVEFRKWKKVLICPTYKTQQALKELNDPELWLWIQKQRIPRKIVKDVYRNGNDNLLRVLLSRKDMGGRPWGCDVKFVYNWSEMLDQLEYLDLPGEVTYFKNTYKLGLYGDIKDAPVPFVINVVAPGLAFWFVQG